MKGDSGEVAIDIDTRKTQHASKLIGTHHQPKLLRSTNELNYVPKVSTRNLYISLAN